MRLETGVSSKNGFRFMVKRRYGLRVHRKNQLIWPTPIGADAHRVFGEFIEKMGDIPWFLMGRSLLQFQLLGRFDEKDKDIDIAIRVEDEQRTRQALLEWPVVQYTHDKEGRIHQILYQPSRVILDIHVFRPPPEHLGYINQLGKWVCRPAFRFDTETVDSEYGPVRVPSDPEGFLHDDYGPGWEQKY